ncbi:MAG: hypothetical protein HZT43_19915 [Exiguobacterium profundum]|nr:MAG: hypothetical protein HZT43_19915 [Exiguobacterium profundum]
MPFFIALLGALAAGYYFWRRSRNAANIATELMDVASDVRLAARRFGFKRQADIHPVEAVEDPASLARLLHLRSSNSTARRLGTNLMSCGQPWQTSSR